MGRGRQRSPTRGTARHRWQASEPMFMKCVYEMLGRFYEAALVSMCQPAGQVFQRNPGHVTHFVVADRQVATAKADQEVSNCFVHQVSFRPKPVFDAAERGDHLTAGTGFFGDLTDRGLLGAFAAFDRRYRLRARSSASEAAAVAS